MYENMTRWFGNQRKMKARAPPPPGKPDPVDVPGERKPSRDLGLSPQQNLINMKENLHNSTVDITVVLPSGLEKKSVVNGSHAMIDLLVELCLQNHLNPSHHALEIRSLETQQPLSFKPNTLVGALNVHTVFLKEKVPEEKAKPGPPKVPEKSVRLVVNYLRTQKAVVRVSPEVPLQNILPVICAKCEVSPEHVILLRDNIAGEELELSKSLNELGIKELYAWDNKRETFRKSSFGDDETDKEKKKFLGFFKVNKRSNSKAEQPGWSGRDINEDGLQSASAKGFNGCRTTPNSPSVSSRSITLGPSVSLSNISGMSVKSEMKKRRAPPPPSLPSPGVPVQDKASEKVSLGSQIDLQKKKRRAPAPPPAQPPLPSPQVPNRMEDQEENRKSMMVSLTLGPSSNCAVDGIPLALSETDETVSVGSCFASEDPTEDSGVMSSPSDIVSLDSQHDSVKSKDKWATDQEDSSDQDLSGAPEVGPQKSPSWERTGSGQSHQRTEKTALAFGDEEDLLVSGQFQRTLVKADEDLEEMEENFETDTGSLTSSVNIASSHSTQDAMPTSSNEDTIPVTFIGEVLDDPVDLGVFSNRNNNAGSFDLRNLGARRAQLLSFQAEDSQSLRKAEEVPKSYAPSHDPGKETRWTFPNTSKGVNSIEIRPKLTTSVSKLHADALNAPERKPACGRASSDKTPAALRGTAQPLSQEEGHTLREGLPPPSWYRRGDSPGGSYGLKYGLTTYKIVPPKSERRCYDRGVSLSTGAIKIDELGNLVSPAVNGTRTIALPSSVLETDEQPIGKVKEFWRSNSMEKQSKVSKGHSLERTSTTLPANPRHPESRHLADPAPPVPTLTVPRKQALLPEDGRCLEEGKSQSPIASPLQPQGPAATSTDVSFVKPQRRTSSQYMASALAKRMGSASVHTDAAAKHNGAERGSEGKTPNPIRHHLATKSDRTPSPPSEIPIGKDAAKQPRPTLPQSNGEESAVGTHLSANGSSPYGKLSAHDCPTGVLQNSSASRIRVSQPDHVSVAQSCGFGGKQSTRNQKTSSVAEPQSVLHSTATASSRPTNNQASPKAWVNGSKWPPVSSEPPHSLKGSTTNSHKVLEMEQKPNSLSPDAHETEGTSTPSIFGPKKKFKPIIQRPAPKDMSLHSALMEAIHSAGGKEKLRKTAEHTPERGSKKPSYSEAESERSALLAAIRGHSGACSLKKVSSFASEELQSLRDAGLSAHISETPQQNSTCAPPLPPPPPPTIPAPPVPRMASKFSTNTLNNTVDARQALMDAIRSGTGAARLKKVPLLV
ncbi:protein cordon-bleu isoform X2 [Echinops telfairi]|uniref:Protein cordon-bleu isoform X2 n=1 Tax=Echinops telfairi TaxID=9371 RepID=A0AC55CQK1_ECHTE|nr:protein cordon-bleu isoform X2 [Echinops telfairi]